MEFLEIHGIFCYAMEFTCFFLIFCNFCRIEWDFDEILGLCNFSISMEFDYLILWVSWNCMKLLMNFEDFFQEFYRILEKLKEFWGILRNSMELYGIVVHTLKINKTIPDEKLQTQLRLKSLYLFSRGLWSSTGVAMPPLWCARLHHFQHRIFLWAVWHWHIFKVRLQIGECSCQICQSLGNLGLVVNNKWAKDSVHGRHNRANQWNSKTNTILEPPAPLVMNQNVPGSRLGSSRVSRQWYLWETLRKSYRTLNCRRRRCSPEQFQHWSHAHRTS